MISESLPSAIELRDFLKSLGWFQLKGELEFGLFVFENKQFPKRQLTYPIDLSAPDYAEAVNLVIDKLSDMMGLPSQTLWNRIRFLLSDTLRFRLMSGKENGDSLPLEFVGGMISGVLLMLKSTASMVAQPRLHHPRSGGKKEKEFIGACRFAHTEPGSFVLRVACPLNAMGDDGNLVYGNDVQPPFTRRVTHKLQDGVSQIVNAIESDAVEQFVEQLKIMPEPSVSAKFCEALLKFHEPDMVTSLELDIDWSAKKPVSESMRKPIRIQSDYFGSIEKIQRELRSMAEPQIATFTGTVEQLDGQIGEDGRRCGKIVLALIIDGKPTKVRTSVNSDQYLQADIAHMNKGSSIHVTGYLLPGQPPQPFKLTDFKLVG